MCIRDSPETVPSTTVDRQCGSSQQATHFAAQGVIAGAYDIVVAAGVEVMTTVPMGASFADGKYGVPFGDTVMARYAPVGGLVPQGIGAEMIADKWGLSREDLDAFGAESQNRAVRATADEGIRDGVSVESLGALKPAFKPDGKVTAGNSSQICDGASAVLIMSEEKANELGLRPRARFHTFAPVSYTHLTLPTNREV